MKSIEEEDPQQLDELTDQQLEQMIELIKTGRLGFEVHRTSAGHWSHDIGILVDHDELMTAIRNLDQPI